MISTTPGANENPVVVVLTFNFTLPMLHNTIRHTESASFTQLGIKDLRLL